MEYAIRTEELEKAYRLMWLNYLRGNQKSLSINVELGKVLAEMDAMA